MTRDAGLTLLETLVAMSLLALVGVMAAGGVDFGRAAWERTEAVSARAAEEHVVAAFLARQVRAAVPLRRRTGDREPPVWFEGRPERVVFLAPFAAAAAPPDLRLIAIGRDDEADTLVLRSADAGALRPALRADGPVEVLLDGVTALRLRFWDRAGGGWTDDWTGREGVPALVEIAIEREGGRTLPVIRVEPGR